MDIYIYIYIYIYILQVVDLARSRSTDIVDLSELQHDTAPALKSVATAAVEIASRSRAGFLTILFCLVSLMVVVILAIKHPEMFDECGDEARHASLHPWIGRSFDEETTTNHTTSTTCT